MPRYFTCEAALSTPLPTYMSVLAVLKDMHDGKTPVRASELARRTRVHETTVIRVLRHAEYQGKVKQVETRGWIPIQS